MKSIKSDKGTAGLTVLLSVITILFVIGLLVMIFTLMNTRLVNNDALYTESSGSIINESYNASTEANNTFSVADYRNVVCTIVYVGNRTSAGNPAQVPASNYTQTNCQLSNTSSGEYSDLSLWNVTYTYTYLHPSEAVNVANDTTTSLSGVTDWFSLFIVITAMVVLILLTVIIITAIRSSGMMKGGSA